MKFNDFINADKNIMMIITVEDFKRTRPFLQKFYTAKELERIDKHCSNKTTDYTFLLCNPHFKEENFSPMLPIGTLTFAEKVPFNAIEF